MPKANSDKPESKSETEQKRDLHERRKGQLVDARDALKRLQGDLLTLRLIQHRRDALSDHSGGFYYEMEKLAKGKTLVPVTNLMLEDANNIIRDAKEIVTNDVYLDRIKEFVAAGDNPVYPDVVVRIRSVRDSLARFQKELEAQHNLLKANLRRAETLIGALEYFLDDDVEVGEDEDKNCPTKEAVEDYVEGDVSDSCFSYFKDSYETYFDFEKLDAQTVPEYLLITPESAAEEHSEEEGEAEEEEDGEA